MKKLDTKKVLKTFKLNETTISTILGVLVIVVAGILVFNYIKKGQKGTTIPASSTQQEESKMEEEKTEKKYTVKKGQSLWLIAEEVYGSGFNWVDIAKENNIKNPNLIKEGQELKLPTVEVKAVAATIQTDEKIVGASYTVAKGDNLWQIAVRAYGDGYRWVDIAKENKLANPNLIHSGNVLTLPR